MAKMREMPVRDAFTDNGVLREDGRMVHSMYLFEVKKPEESKGTWDYYNPHSPDDALISATLTPIQI